MSFRANVDSNSSNEDSIDSDNKFWRKPVTDDDDGDDLEKEVEEGSYIMFAKNKRKDVKTHSPGYQYTRTNDSSNSISNQQQQQQPPPLATATSTHIIAKPVINNHQDRDNSTKRYQTKMLLASLIEHFCRSYGDTPDANRKVFFLICQTLRSLGIIDAEFVDEMTSVRSAFQQAFNKLFYTAVQTVRNQDLLSFDDNPLPAMRIKSAPANENAVEKGDIEEECSFRSSSTTSAEPGSSGDTSSNSSNYNSRRTSFRNDVPDYFSVQATSSETANVSLHQQHMQLQEHLLSSSFSNSYPSVVSNSHKMHSPISTSFQSFMSGCGAQHQHQPHVDFFYNLSVQNSRYNNDFIELNLIGKGGFASAYRARNKLDGVDYAIKKIRLGRDIEEKAQQSSMEDNPYEKIFREIKNLARLEHNNVIRYYSSWLEYDMNSEMDDDKEVGTDESDWEEDTSQSYHKHHSTAASYIESDEDESFIFRGRDPTFSSDDHSHSFSFSAGADISFGGGDEVSGMSQIQFGESSDYFANDTTNASTSLSMNIPYKNTNCNIHPSQQKEHRKKPTKNSNSNSNKNTKTKNSSNDSTGWTLFIQMQLCPTTLHDYIRFRNKQYAEDGDLSVVDSRRNIEIFAQILEGTAYIHDQGLIHRDLKPSNIFLTLPSGSTYVNDVDGKRRRRVSNVGLSQQTNNPTPTASMTLGSAASPNPNSALLAVFDNNNSNNSIFTMWNESLVPKIGDFGLAAEAIHEEGSGDTVLVPTPISSTPPSPKISPISTSAASNSSNSTLAEVVTSPGSMTSMSFSNTSGVQAESATTSAATVRIKNKPKRPKAQRMRTVGVGTRTYASPEQLAVPAQAYDEKVDIYSLGIILFELFQPFSTGMERADTIDKLKRGIFPEGFLELYPKVSALILWMMDKRPDYRPSAHQLLEFELFSHPSAQDDGDLCLTLKAQLESRAKQLERKNKEIEELKSKLRQVELEKEQTVSKMQRQLDEMQVKLSYYQQRHYGKNEKMEGSPVKNTAAGGTIPSSPTPTTSSSTVHPVAINNTLRKSCLSPSNSFLRKKKEVRWSALDMN
ncbi:hypothetical protein BDF20DRAFT_913581 [Mycotypha africana]|uniref:uncharacterized protein n=1 Tax=Mycotypha africana TaxID=64632 RepID=UPI002300AEC5|nr:uncharacterized protein BDF20DRAFT_913581 [Mycotypha africana]KAI8977225.1 hypothetical protein BDF20DRAFT_913581 [Mycotypha africana]